MNDYIVVELYVDDRAEFDREAYDWVWSTNYPEEVKERLMSSRTIGHFYAYWEQFKFDKQSQPLYVLLDINEEKLIKEFTYMARDKDHFRAKLKQGLDVFYQKRKVE